MPKIPQEKKQYTETWAEAANKQPKTGGLSAKLKGLETTETENTLPHIVIRARAGAGKTSTMIEGLRLLVEGETKLNPSEQQAVIWEELLQSQDTAKSFCMVAFNKEIAEELKKRLPKRDNCSAMTLHSLGYKACIAHYGFPLELDGDRSQKIIAKLAGHEGQQAYSEYMQRFGVMVNEIASLVGYCKLNNEVQPTFHYLLELSDMYGLDIDITMDTVSKVRAVLQESHQRVNGIIDYNDQIWLPVVNNLQLTKYDILFTDESQDLSHCQQQLALRCGKRIVICGDEFQSCYAFAGSDARSYRNLISVLKKSTAGCNEYPLTVSYRCSQAVIREAQKWVPDIQPCLTNPEGAVNYSNYDELPTHDCPSCKKKRVSYKDKGLELCLDCMASWAMSYRDIVKDGDMVICRCNGPLVSQYFKFLKAGRKAFIRGRKDVGGSLIRTVKKIMRREKLPNAKESIDHFVTYLHQWKIEETGKETTKEKPSQLKLNLISDKFDCLITFSEQSSSVSNLVQRIENVFSDKEKVGICLSTIHQAKGLESRRVFFLMPKGAECPGTWAKTDEEKQQNLNLRYIGCTRAIEDLIYVT